MVLRACSLRDVDVLYIQVGSTRLTNVNAFEDDQNSTKMRVVPAICRKGNQPEQKKTVC